MGGDYPSSINHPQTTRKFLPGAGNKFTLELHAPIFTKPNLLKTLHPEYQELATNVPH